MKMNKTCMHLALIIGILSASIRADEPDSEVARLAMEKLKEYGRKGLAAYSEGEQTGSIEMISPKELKANGVIIETSAGKLSGNPSWKPNDGDVFINVGKRTKLKIGEHVLGFGECVLYDGGSLAKSQLQFGAEAAANELLGMWKCIRGEKGGVALAAAEAAAIRMAAKKQMFTLVEGGVRNLYSYTLDPSANPRRLTFICASNSAESRGIYKFENDELVICFGTAQPDEFATKSDNATAMYAFRREPLLTAKMAEALKLFGNSASRVSAASMSLEQARKAADQATASKGWAAVFEAQATFDLDRMSDIVTTLTPGRTPAIKDLQRILGPAGSTEKGFLNKEAGNSKAKEVEWHRYEWLEFAVAKGVVIALRADSRLMSMPANAAKQAPQANPGRTVASIPAGLVRSESKSNWPAKSSDLRGSMEVRVRNPNEFSVKVGLRSGGKGKDFSVGANGVKSAFVPNGRYDIYFQYSTDPDGLYQGDSFTLSNNGVEIKIVKVVNGNYGIRKVR